MNGLLYTFSCKARCVHICEVIFLFMFMYVYVFADSATDDVGELCLTSRTRGPAVLCGEEPGKLEGVSAMP